MLRGYGFSESFAIIFFLLFNTLLSSSILLLPEVDKSDDEENVLSLLQDIMSSSVTNKVLFGELKLKSESINSVQNFSYEQFFFDYLNVVYMVGIKKDSIGFRKGNRKGFQQCITLDATLILE